MRADSERLVALHRYAILDTDCEPEFDRVTRLAAAAFAAPISLISLVDDRRQWMKSAFGFDGPRSLAIESSLCAHVILDRVVMVVPDATQDPRFAAYPPVRGSLGLRFYAGAPLITLDGVPLGTVCLIDTVPRNDFDPDKQALLADYAALVIDLMEARRLASRMRQMVADALITCA